MQTEKIKNLVLNFFKKNKGLFYVFSFLIVLIAFFVLFQFFTKEGGAHPTKDFYGYDSESRIEASEESQSLTPDSGITGIEIREGFVTAETENLDRDERLINESLEIYQGHTESAGRSESESYLFSYLTVRVPSENFYDFFENIRDQIEIENYDIRNFRIEIDREESEIDLIRKSLEAFSDMRRDLERMPIGQERIELLFKITEKELELKERERRVEHQIGDVMKRGDMATLNITLREKLEVELWPKDVLDQFRESFRDSIQKTITSVVSMITFGVFAFFKAIEWIVYAVAFAIPVLVVYKIIRKIYKKRQG